MRLDHIIQVIWSESFSRYAGRTILDTSSMPIKRGRPSMEVVHESVQREGWVLWQVMVLTTPKDRQLDLPPYLMDTGHCAGR